MGDAPKRPVTQPRLPRVAVEESRTPPTGEPLPVASPIGRKPTPIGMPAPPANAPEEERQSHDDIEHVLEMEKLERERAVLLAKLQDSEAENRLLRETAPTVIFPPPSMPPSAPDPKPPTRAEVDVTPPSKRSVLGHRLTQLATGAGIFVAIAWNAFNSYRAQPEKVEAVQARVAQSEQQRDKAVAMATLERQRTLRALRSTECMFKQVRGALQRQGIDLTSLPPGGIKVLKLADEDPNRPGAPRFIAEEKCEDFPKLPPETGGP